MIFSMFPSNIDSQLLLKAIFENSYNPIVITDAQLEIPGPKFLYINKAFTEMTGYTLEELKDKTPRILQGEDSSREVLDELKNKLKKGEFFIGRTINYKKDGTKYHLEWNISPVKDTKGKIIQFIAIQRDISIEQEYQHLLQNIFDKQDDMVVLTDGNTATFENKKFKKFFQVKTIEEFKKKYGCVCNKFVAIDGYYYKKDANENWINTLLNLPQEKRLVRILDHKSNPQAFSVVINKFEEHLSLISFKNVTHLVSEREKYKTKAFQDTLTGIFNRAYFDQNFRRLINEYHTHSSKLAIALLDIDHFKSINDTYGHDIGDLVLKQFVKTIQKNSRTTDILIRWGGEEFILILKVTSQEDFPKILEHIRATIEHTKFLTVGQKTCSIGGTIYKGGEDIYTAIKRADIGLYEAKENGRNKIIIK